MAASANLLAALALIARKVDPATQLRLAGYVWREDAPQDVASRILADAPPECSAEAIGGLLAYMGINHEFIAPSLRRWWLEGDDPRKIEVAFHVWSDQVLGQMEQSTVVEVGCSPFSGPPEMGVPLLFRI